MNTGKKFEEEFKKSVPKGVYFYRLRDNAASFSGGNNTRFSSYNICDCQLFSDKYDYFIELKSTQKPSLSFKNIRKNQLDGLASINHKRIKPLFIINFRAKEKTYVIYANLVKEYIDKAERQSIPIGWCKENGTEIETIKLKVNYKYNLEKFINEVENEG